MKLSKLDLQSHNSTQNEDIKKITSLYSNSGWKRFLAKFRFWYAPFKEIESLVPKNGVIVDLGCAEGILANFLAVSSNSRNVIGIELDRNRLKIANHKIKNISFHEGDITKIKIPSCDTIILFHVLHHLLTYEDQEKVLKKCNEALQANGKILIVEIYIKPSFSYLLSWFTDHFLVAWFFEKRIYSPILFRNIDDWEKVLEKNRFHCIAYPVKGFLPFSNVIFECDRINS